MCACDETGTCPRCREDEWRLSPFRPDPREDELVERYEEKQRRAEDDQSA